MKQIILLLLLSVTFATARPVPWEFWNNYYCKVPPEKEGTAKGWGKTKALAYQDAISQIPKGSIICCLGSSTGYNTKTKLRVYILGWIYYEQWKEYGVGYNDLYGDKVFTKE